MDASQAATAIPRSLIRLYQAVSYVWPRRCRFVPSCSQYVYESLEVHGLWRGGWHGMMRILKCHPWHPGGDDPVQKTGSMI